MSGYGSTIVSPLRGRIEDKGSLYAVWPYPPFISVGRLDAGRTDDGGRWSGS